MKRLTNSVSLFQSPRVDASISKCLQRDRTRQPYDCYLLMNAVEWLKHKFSTGNSFVVSTISLSFR